MGSSALISQRTEAGSSTQGTESFRPLSKPPSNGVEGSSADGATGDSGILLLQTMAVNGGKNFPFWCK
ncbi:hypothetical protein ES332_D08G253500v1 [Gossypium tomentosum]|uniref:Uncharacterized protein n=1 Tax=Gossypium tomentosum TaxID=34277 RepID=A0A5D2JZK0_GOSTO|nr:hypothetical protein ES332_D08G253500v1 [Gossypium tomentosum]